MGWSVARAGRAMAVVSCRSSGAKHYAPRAGRNSSWGWSSMVSGHVRGHLGLGLRAALVARRERCNLYLRVFDLYREIDGGLASGSRWRFPRLLPCAKA
eukprot:scaffold1534_cov122-Isochrysis_galbana.AAC.3